MLFFSVLTDLIHLLKLSLLCDLFFQFKRQKDKTKYFIILSVMISTSVGMYLYDNDFIEMLVYIVVICISICMLHSEKMYIKIISALWIILITSMIDAMFTMMIRIATDMIHISYNTTFDFIASIISLIFVMFVGKLYNHRYKVGIKDIGIKNLALFTILALVDTFVALMVGVIAVKGVKENLKLVFSISVIFVILGILLQLAAVILLFVQRNIYKEKKQITEKYLNEQKNHYEYLENRELETKKFRHDLRNHMQLLSDLTRNKNYEEFDNYVDKINLKIDGFGNLITVNNGIVDAIINKYYSEALKSGVDMKVSGKFPKECRIDAYDLCTIFSNVLSNALEATVKTEKKEISLDCRYENSNIILVAKNTFNDIGQFSNDKIITNKSDLNYHGFGLENIRNCVEKNNGVLDIEIEQGIFQIMIMLDY